jgi:hypothetical protein
MKRPSAVVAFAALVAATAALAQQPYPQTPQEPPASSSQQTSPSQADQQALALMKECLAKIQAANPNASKEDVKAYCEEQVKKSLSPEK